MRKIYLILITSLLMLSCGGDKKNSTASVIEKGTLEDMRTKRTELVSKSDDLRKELESL
ncbi:MAG: membrane fusion protein (multidrug efflux system), partial [Flavobacterium sp.]